MNSTDTAQAFQVCVLEDFALTAARRFVNFCVGRSHTQGRIHVALTGGRTARLVYEALARPEICEGLDATAIEFWQGDERPVPPAHPDSNWGMAERAFLNAAGVPETNRHRMRAEAPDLNAAATEYEQLLRDRLPQTDGPPALDLLLLGMGDDGHTASLFPGTSALNERHRLVVPNPVPQLGMTRLTVTYPLINAARAVWILATGPQKADVARRVLEARDPSLPAVHVVPTSGPLTWLLDPESAARLASHTVNYG